MLILPQGTVVPTLWMTEKSLINLSFAVFLYKKSTAKLVTPKPTDPIIVVLASLGVIRYYFKCSYCNRFTAVQRIEDLYCPCCAFANTSFEDWDTRVRKK